MDNRTVIHVQLLDEGTEVWRPVEAIALENGTFRIVSENPHPDDERWQFTNGQVVCCETKIPAQPDSQPILVAVQES